MSNKNLPSNYDDFLPPQRKRKHSSKIVHRHTIERADGSSISTENCIELNEFSGMQGSGWFANGKSNTPDNQHLRQDKRERVMRSKTIIRDSRGNAEISEFASMEVADMENIGIDTISNQIEDRSNRNQGLLGFDSTISF